MSAPAFAWALERGAALGLTPAERLVLIYLADQANGEKVCWPGQPRIAKFTGLAIRTVIAALKRLEARQLIRAASAAGRVTYYHILRETPANGAVATPANHPVATPANGAVADDSPLQTVQGHPCKRDGEPLHMTAPTPANGADDPKSTQEEDPSKPARAGASASPSPLPHGRAVAAPEPPTNTPHNPDAWDDPAVPFDEALAKLPSRRLHLATPEPDVITEDDFPQTAADMQRMAAAALAELQGTARALAPPVPKVLTRNEQLEELVPLPPRPERPPLDPVHTAEQQITAALAGITAEQADRARRAFADRAARAA